MTSKLTDATTTNGTRPMERIGSINYLFADRYDMATLPNDYDWPDILAALGALLVVVSMPMTWIEADDPIIEVDGVMQASQSGLESSDGIIVLGTVIVLGLVILVGRIRAGSWGWLAILPALVAGLIGLGVPLIYILDPTTGAVGSESALNQLSAGLGLYLTFLGGVAIMAAGVLGVVSRFQGE